jgi:hypothetical protein
MKDKLNKIKSDIDKLIDKMHKEDLLGPIGYLEDCLVNIEQALEEVELFYGDDSEE